jgi:prolyl 4-hydroxylase
VSGDKELESNAASPLPELTVQQNSRTAFALAFSYLQAQGVTRDLQRARKLFMQAAELGHSQAKRIAIALLANGMTGGRDWTGALARLQAIKSSGDSHASRQLQLLDAMDLNAEGDPNRDFEGDRLSERPEVTVFRNLFTKAECSYLADVALPAYRPATVGHVAGGQVLQVVQQIRTCDVAAFPWIAEDPVIHALNRRIAAAAQVPVECGEPIQILRYRPAQEFKPHRDYTQDTDNQRVLTMLVYLNDDYTAGETLFLDSGLKFRGDPGDGLLFRNADESGAPDPHSLHAGLPVQSGEKVVASRWIRQKRFGPSV